MHNDSKFSSGGIFRYTMLPGIIPRFLRIFSSGFGILAFYIANIFGAVRIFPKHHSFLQPYNYNKYGLIRVFVEASKNINWDKKNLDQVFIYIAILTGLVVLFMQFFVLGGVFISNFAYAKAAPPDSLIFFSYNFNEILGFAPGETDQDYALRFLDLVFGLPDTLGPGAKGFFQSCVGNAAVDCVDYEGQTLPPYAGYPYPHHVAFHSLIEFYNYTIIGIAFIILFYYVVTMAAETTIHGTLWGQRGNKTWIPVRVIVFCALIMPFYQGFNLAQIITLDAAYFGTGAASNAWREVNRVISGELAGEYDTLVKGPDPGNYPSSTSMVHFMTVVKTCAVAENRINRRNINAYIVKNDNRPLGVDPVENCLPLVGTSFANALEFSGREDIRIVFGERYRPFFTIPTGGRVLGEPVPCSETSSAAYADMPLRNALKPGYVVPYCGEIVLSSSGPDPTTDMIRDGHYSDLIDFLWGSTVLDGVGEGFVDSATDAPTNYDFPFNTYELLIRNRNNAVNLNIGSAVTFLLSTPYFQVPLTLRQCGWMCAAVYYNRIAEANGRIQTAVFGMPQIIKWPLTTEHVLENRNMANMTSDSCDMFSPVIGSERGVDFPEESNFRVASVISTAHEYLCNNNLLSADFSDTGNDAFRHTMGSLGDSPVRDIIQMIFGLNGLFDMRQNTDLHPLAQLSLLGKGMVESTIRVFGYSVLGTMVEALGKERISSEAITTIDSLSGVMTSIGMIGLTIGFILYYVIPYMPFIYFLFAAADWVKAIFEAMVGVPLWALAHLRLDGEGLIGDAASGGYWLILEIFLRPFLILVGFMAGITLFMGLVKVLNDIFDLVVANAGGFNAANSVYFSTKGAVLPGTEEPFSLDVARGPIDQFFYTIVYAIIVYILANSSFKMVDLIPNEILRWAGVGVKGFSDFSGDPASNVMRLIGGGVKTAAVLGGGVLGKVSSRPNNPSAISQASRDDPDERS